MASHCLLVSISNILYGVQLLDLPATCEVSCRTFLERCEPIKKRTMLPEIPGVSAPLCLLTQGGLLTAIIRKQRKVCRHQQQWLTAPLDSTTLLPPLMRR